MLLEGGRRVSPAPELLFLPVAGPSPPLHDAGQSFFFSSGPFGRTEVPTETLFATA